MDALQQERNRQLLQRITQEPGKFGGRPCIRGLRIRVSDVLEWLSSGMTEAEILEDFPSLEPEDIKAALYYASLRLNHAHILT